MTAAVGNLRFPEHERLVSVGKKATGGGSAVLPGKVIKLTQSTGVWAIAGTGAAGQLSVVPSLSPLNTDSGDDILFLRAGAEVYVTADGAIKPNAAVMVSGSTAGEVVTYATTAIATTPAQADVEAARDEYTKIVGIYLGHEGEGGSEGKPVTDAADGDVICIRLGGGLLQ